MSKTQKVTYWIATGWLALGMISTGAVQLFKGKTGAGGVDSVVAHLGYPMYMLTLLGVAKILGSIAVLVPKFPIVKEWAYAGFFFMMSGALFSHIVAGDSAKEIFPVILLLVLTAVSWYFRPADRKPVLVAA
jgi:uncharacterized membrane protein YphA (DoxX/SURF4 family)